MGCDPKDTAHFGGIWVSQNSDVTIAVIGLTPVYEGEEGDAFLSDNGADRRTLSLPPGQIAFLKALRKASSHPIIVVVTGGSAVDIDAIAPYANAILFAWYPGEQGGVALADILFGRVSPSGHLPVTFYRSLADLPPYEDYNMQGRTYRYYKGPVEYPFGFGLSYTKFTYGWGPDWPSIKKPKATKGWVAYPLMYDSLPPIRVSSGDTVYWGITIENDGNKEADAVPQVYVKYPDNLPGGKQMPLKELKDFKRVTVQASGKSAANDGPFHSESVNFALPVSALRKWDPATHAWKLYPGAYRLVIGENADDEKLSCKFIIK
jgi:beta-glucosidase